MTKVSITPKEKNKIAPAAVQQTSILTPSPPTTVTSEDGGIEEIPTQPPPTFDQILSRELVKFDTVVPKIEELKEQFLVLSINGIEDKEGYEKVKEALSFMVDKRCRVEDKRKELKADALKFGNAVDARAKEITVLMAPIESYLREQKEKIDTIKKQEEERKEQEKQQKLVFRHNQLSTAGMSLIGNEYIWQSKLDAVTNESLPKINLETLSDEDFEKEVIRVTAVIKQESDYLQAEQQKRDAEVKQLAEEREQFEKQKAKLVKEIEEARMLTINNMGVMEPHILSSLLERARGGVSSEQWDEALALAKKDIEEYQDKKRKTEEAEKEKERNQAILDKRISAFFSMGFSLVSIGSKSLVQYNNRELEYDVSDYIGLTDEVFEKEMVIVRTGVDAIQTRLKKEQADREEKIRKDADIKAQADLEAKQKADEEKRKEEEAKMKDKDKLISYCTRLLDVEAPEMKTDKYKKILVALQDVIKSYAGN